MKRFLPGMPDYLVRLLGVFGVIVVLALVVRSLLPSEMKDAPVYQGLATEREKARAVRYAGSSQCADCHEEAAKKREGYHRTLSCETCHGAASAHVENPGEVKPPLPQTREFCVRCHGFNMSRPTGFPQINPAAHNPLKVCMACHDPHNPKPPQTPTECEACHAEIARTKAMSPHVLLTCTTCHEVPEGHKVAPRAVLALIPRDRVFCGKCHAKTSTVAETPKIDIVTHGEKYLCWQCHYPHMPEVK